MNAEQLQAIKDRVEKATPGPWIIEESRFGNFNAASENENYDLPACLMNKVDAQFVTNAREDIPALIAEVERLQKALQFYANENNHKRLLGYVNGEGEPFYNESQIMQDKGEIARKALVGE